MTKEQYLETIESLTATFATRAADCDEQDRFVAEDYAAMRENTVFSAGVPEELGGGGVSHRTLCAGLRIMGRGASSTALSLSMHTHLVASQVYNHLHGKPGRALLEKVAGKGLVLVSTGANDWLQSNGTLERADGGYRLNARKVFASGSPGGDLLITSAPFQDPKEGPQVLHFPVALQSEGVRVENDWKTLGMRGTGSNTVVLENVFVPEESVALRRPQGSYHPVFNVIMAVALPLVMSAYVGTAEAAARIARERCKKRLDDPSVPYLLGEMENQLAIAQLALDSMIAISNDYQFEPSPDIANAIAIRKSLAARACIAVAEKALEATGGAGFFRSMGLERLLRDVHGGQFHPLQEKRQQLFTGRLAMGLPPMVEGL